MYKLKILSIIILSTVLLVGCSYDEEEGCYHAPLDCSTTPYTQGELTVNVTINGENPTATINIYSGEIDPFNPPAAIHTATVNTESYTVTLDIGDYSAMVEYSIGDDLVRAIDGDSIDSDSSEYCEGTCYELDNGDIDISFDSEKFVYFVNKGDDNCFIATAAFGSKFSDEVKILRSFRDKNLLTNPAGRMFVKFYYYISPPFADIIREHELLRSAIRIILISIIYFIKYPLLILIFSGLLIVLIFFKTQKGFFRFKRVV